MFLPARLLIAVLPPTDESTCASSVVGICTNRAPRFSRPCRKTGEIAHDAAAERDDQVVALRAQPDQLVQHGRQIGERF